VSRVLLGTDSGWWVVDRTGRTLALPMAPGGATFVVGGFPFPPTLPDTTTNPVQLLSGRTEAVRAVGVTRIQGRRFMLVSPDWMLKS
jgi:hypothetical protein